MENILAFAYPMKREGVLPVLGGGENHPFPMVATRDIGDVAADALLAPPAATQWIELSGPRSYSFVDAAAGRIEDSRPYREGVSCAARCGGAYADESSGSRRTSRVSIAR